jgi:dihydroorotate dehydrogenase electron transfer subunit
MSQFHKKVTLINNESLGNGIFRLTMKAPEIAGVAVPGQFVMVRVTGGFDPLLRRPFSIHRVTADGTVAILFKVLGRGTALLAEKRSGETIDCLGPLGFGFPLKRNGNICLVGGGMGIAPLYYLAQKMISSGQGTANDLILLGARSRVELELFAGEFDCLGGTVKTATDDGSLGHHGFVPELLDEVLSLKKISRVYSCGPFPMMKSVAAKTMAAGVECFVSLEADMACGLGACLGCTVPGTDRLIHVCQRGPVLAAGEVLWEK